VCEAELLPGDDAILGKDWVPWAERLRPGDIGPGDVLPFKADDPRLEPGWTPTGDPELDEVAIDELALARVRVLAPQGIDEAAERWYRGSHGPTTAGALASSAACGSCGFLVPLQGSLGTVFGVCANEWSPDDGRVVSLDHGCGAHSETDAGAVPSDWPAPAPLIDEMLVDVVDRGAPLGEGAREGDGDRRRGRGRDRAAAAAAAVAEDLPVEESPAGSGDVGISIDVAVVEELAVAEPSADAGPIEDLPVEEAPIEAGPADEAPADEAPVDEAPADEAPVGEAPVDEAPVGEAPADEAPADEAPVDETPAADDETPGDEAPADEAVTDAPAAEPDAER
jgi:hypothetical protein